MQYLILFILSLKKIIYFNWRIISLQYCDGFCHTSVLIGLGHTRDHPPPCPPHLLSHLIPPGCHVALAFSALHHTSNPPLAICFTYGNVYVSVLFSQVIWLVSFSIMPSRFIHVVKNVTMSFF